MIEWFHLYVNIPKQELYSLSQCPSYLFCHCSSHIRLEKWRKGIEDLLEYYNYLKWLVAATLIKGKKSQLWGKTLKPCAV